MMDLNSNDLVLRARLAEREREVRRLVHVDQPPSRWRARLAARLAGMAMCLDRDAAGERVSGQLKALGR